MLDPEQPPDPDAGSARKTPFEAAEPEREATLVRELWWFIVDYKAWWLTPIIIALLALGTLAILNGTGAAPFIYSFF